MPKKMSTAIKACYHIERRYRESANFAYVMQMTESMELVQSAICEHEGKPPMTFKERLKDQQNVFHDWKHDVGRLEKELAKVQRKLDAARAGEDYVSEEDEKRELHSMRAICRVEELMQYAELRGSTITPEQLADAIAGNYVFV